MSKVLQAHIVLFIVGTFYAINYIVAKDIMPTYIGASGFIFYRVLGATLLFWLVHFFISKERIDRKDIPRLALCALFGVAMNQLFFFNGLSLTTPINASVIMTSNPILVLLASAVILKERITISKSIGVGLGIVGALLLILLPIIMGRDTLAWSQGDSTGDLMIFINAMSYGLYLILVKPLMKKYEAMTVIKWVFTLGLIYVIPFGFEQAMEVDWMSMPQDIFWGVVYVVICVTFLVYFLNVFAMKTVSPSVVSAYIYLQPVLAGALSISLGKEKLHWIQLLAAVFIFSGVYLVSIRKKPSTVR